MKAILVVALVIAAAVAAHPRAHNLKGYTFEQYVVDFGKKYSSVEEFARRKSLFNKKLADIHAHNAAGMHSWKKGVNHMSDWTIEEFKRLNGGRSRAMGHLADKSLQLPHVAKTLKDLPPAVDYRNSIPSVLTAVKDQGMCGSCWAHGSTEQMETYWALATNELFVLSQQQVTACAPNPDQCGGTGGCMGSTAELAFQYVANAGLTQEWEYPYTAYNGTTGVCRGSNDAHIQLSGYVKLNANSQDDVMNTLATVGPLAINVDASEWSDYESGVYSGCDYAQNISIDHVVQLVGYGHDGDLNLDYWIVRNSWSPSYGESGFIRVLRQANPECGWDVDPQDGYGCQGGPAQIWVCGMCGILGDTSYPVVKTN